MNGKKIVFVGEWMGQKVKRTSTTMFYQYAVICIGNGEVVTAVAFSTTMENAKKRLGSELNTYKKFIESANRYPQHYVGLDLKREYKIIKVEAHDKMKEE